MTEGETAMKAKELWDSFNDNEKTGVRFGMFPFKQMDAAHKEGHNSKTLAVCLMEIASINGGMRA